MIKKCAKLLDGTIVALEDIDPGDLISYPLYPLPIKDFKTWKKIRGLINAS